VEKSKAIAAFHQRKGEIFPSAYWFNSKFFSFKKIVRFFEKQ